MGKSSSDEVARLFTEEDAVCNSEDEATVSTDMAMSLNSTLVGLGMDKGVVVSTASESLIFSSAFSNADSFSEFLKSNDFLSMKIRISGSSYTFCNMIEDMCLFRIRTPQNSLLLYLKTVKLNESQN